MPDPNLNGVPSRIRYYVDVGEKSVQDVLMEYEIDLEMLTNANPSSKEIIGKTLMGTVFPPGTKLYIPQRSSGGITFYSSIAVPDNGHSTPASLDFKLWSLSTSFVEMNCYFILYASDQKVSDAIYLPVFPNEFTDTNSVSFNSTEVLGRSVTYQTYSNSNRSVSFSLKLHEELVPDLIDNTYDYIHKVVATIESANYPLYNEGKVNPPQILFNIGDQFRIKGILTSCSAVWSAPIINNRLVNCDLSLGVTETTGPYSMNDITDRGGYRGS